MSLYIGWENLVDENETSKTVADPFEGLTVENLRTRDLGLVWRTDQVTGGDYASYVVDSASVTGPFLIGAFNHNLAVEDAGFNVGIHSSGYMTGSDSGGVLQTYPLQIHHPYPGGSPAHSVAVIDKQDTTEVYAVLRLEQPTAALDYLEAGRFWFGPLWELTGARWSLDVRDTGQANRTDEASSYPQHGTRYRTISLTISPEDFAATFGDSGDSTARHFVQAIREIQAGKEVFVSTLVDDVSDSTHEGLLLHRSMIFGRLAQTPTIQSLDRDAYRISLAIEEQTGAQGDPMLHLESF